MTLPPAPAAGHAAEYGARRSTQSVALAKQGAATLRARTSRSTITYGASATITGTLLRPAGAGASGQVVTLGQTPATATNAAGTSPTRALRAT